jgi:hypothetical protein
VRPSESGGSTWTAQCPVAAASATAPAALAVAETCSAAIISSVFITVGAIVGAAVSCASSTLVRSGSYNARSRPMSSTLPLRIPLTYDLSVGSQHEPLSTPHRRAHHHGLRIDQYVAGPGLIPSPRIREGTTRLTMRLTTQSSNPPRASYTRTGSRAVSSRSSLAWMSRGAGS